MTINSDAPGARFALSLAQQDIYFDQLHAPNSPHYNVGGIVTFKNSDAKTLIQAHRLTIEKTEVFGLTLSTDEQGVFQWVNPKPYSGLEYIDLSDDPTARDKVHQWASEQFSRTISLENQALYKARLYRIDDDTLWYVMLAHHLIMDGFGFVNWMDHLSYYYEQHCHNPDKEIPLEAIGWQELVEADQQYLISKRYQKDREFWQQHLKALPEPLLPPCYQHQFADTTEIPSHREVIDLDVDTFKHWQQLAQANGVGLQSWFLAILALYHATVDGREQINIGSALHNRKTHAQKQMLGTFTSVSPVPCSLTGVGSFIELAQQISERQKASYRYGRYPFGHMLRDFGISGHHGGLFDVQFNYLSLATHRILNDFQPHIHRKPHGFESVPLVVTLLEASQGKPAVIEMDVNLAYFTALEGKRLLERYLHIADQVAQNPQIELAQLDLIAKGERELLCQQWQGQPLQDNLATTVVELFERHNSTTLPAAIFADSQMDYSTLNRKANQVARQLIAMGVKPDDKIGLSLPRTLDLFTALLAIFKSGAVCVPLDPNYPKARLAHIIDDSQMQWLICKADNQPDLSGVTCLCFERDSNSIEQQSTDNLPLPDGQSIAYIIYTSGSTGKPKGVAVSHQALAWHIHSIGKGYKLTQNERIAVFTSVNFDPFMEQTWLALCHGYTAVLIDHKHQSGKALLDYLKTQRVTMADLPPSYFEQLMLLPGWAQSIKQSQLKTLIFGGEALNGNLLEQWQQHGLFEHCRLINGYGPTESCITSTFAVLTADDIAHPPIGTPPVGRSAYVLDAKGNLLPSGCPGELYLGGLMLAQGYLNQPQLTANAFIELNINGQTERLYRTGDKVKQLDNGALVFIGRLDEQVKIRGFRVEPGEIAAELNRLESVESALVVAKPARDGQMQLIAYAQTQSHADLTGIKEALEQRLPHYMVPSHIISVDSWPLTLNDKIDVAALPEPEGAKSGHYVAPKTAIEQSLQHIWAQLLNLEAQQLSTTANFFDLGGHSLLAVRVVSEVSVQLGRALTVADLFAAPDIRLLARRVERAPQSNVQPIEARTADGAIPLSFAQQQLWLVDQLSGASEHYHMQVAYKIKGLLDAAKLEHCVVEMIQRHRPLCTVVQEVAQQPEQQLLEPTRFALQKHNFTDLNAAQQTQAIASLIENDRLRPFNLQQDFMVRVNLVKLGEQDAILMFNFHHIAMDGWSLELFFNELSDLYAGKALAPLTVDYGDYALWQRNNQHYDRLLDYWLAHIDDLPLVHNLPLKNPRPAQKNTLAESVELTLSKDLLSALQNIARQHDVTLFMLLHATLAEVISAHSNSEQVVIGTPVANRERSEINDLIGLFVNTVVLKTQHKPQGFDALLAEIKDINLTAQANQSLPFEHLVAASNIERNSAFNPLFQILFSLDEDVPQPDIANVEFSFVPPKVHRVKFDLDITATATDQGLHLSWLYDNVLFDRTLIAEMAEHWANLLRCVIEQKPLQLLDEKQNEALLALSEAPVSYPSDTRPLHLHFAENVLSQPNSIAIKDQDSTLTFAQLDEATNNLAVALHANGIEADDLVAIVLPHSVDTLVAVLAVWRCGAAFVPVDPEYPVERIEYVLKDAAVKVAITQDSMPELSVPQLTVTQAQPDSNITFAEVAPAQLAYVIYTSGSTGQPKGVMVEHQQLTNLAAQMAHWPVGDKTRPWGWVANPVFDASMQAVIALMQGRTVYIVSKSAKLEPHKLKYCVEQEQLGVLDCTPSLLRSWLDGGIADSLPALVIGGEAIDTTLWQQLVHWQQSQGRTALNVYGPTECCVNSTMALIQGEQPTIGRAVGNAKVLLFSSSGQLAPAHSSMGGAVAELYIGGAGVARGYLNLPHLTAERFIDSPYGRLYRTGDHVKLMDNGELQYIGRQDSQLKVRGYRIEPDEIEQALLRCEDVDGAKVLLGSQQQLMAYVISQNTSQEAILAELQNYLPSHMLPAAIVSLWQWPVTASGKIDLSALKALEQIQVTQAPRDDSESQVMAIWQQLLEIDETLDINTSFFALGGHSLLLTRLASQLRQQWAVELELKALFEHNTIAGQAAWLAQLQPASAQPQLSTVPRDGQLPLSAAQQRLWFIDSLEGQSSQYNMVGSYRLDGALNIDALQSALNLLVAEHEILRTNYLADNGTTQAVINAAQPVTLVRHDLSAYASDEQNARLQDCITQAHLIPLDLKHDPLFQAQLFKLSNDSHVLLIKVHHIAADGWSVGLIMSAINRGYDAAFNGTTPESMASQYQYVDFAHWQNQLLQGEVVERELDYWRKQLADVPQLHSLPLDKPRPGTQSFAGAKLTIDLSDVKPLQQLAEQADATLFMLLQSAFALLLNRYSSENDIVMGTPVAGRTQQALESMVGFFVNTLVLRTRFDGQQSFSQLLAANRSTIIDGFNHQQLPFESLVEALNPPRSTAASPLFQILFTLHNQQSQPLTLKHLSVSEIIPDYSQIKFDLELDIEQTDQGLNICWHYNTALFEHASIARMAQNYLTLLEQLPVNLNTPIEQLPFIAPAEQRRLEQFGTSTQILKTSTKLNVWMSIIEMFEAQVQRTPEKLAVALNGDRLTYRELNRKANILAGHLLAQGVGPDKPVGLYVPRGTDLIVSIFAVLKTGGAYVAIDPGYPIERIRYILEDTKAPLVLTQSTLAGDLSGVNCVCVDTLDLTGDGNNLQLEVLPQNLAYLIYTSGSTGRPKGAMITHANVVNLLNWYISHYQLGIDDDVLVFSSTSFDLTQKNLLSPLLCGASLHFATATEYDPVAIVDTIARHNISFTNCAPSAFYPLFDAAVDLKVLNSLRCVLLGGEPIDMTRFGPWLNQCDAQLVNMYGPTECTDIACAYTYQTGTPHNGGLPIGTPNDNVRLYVLLPNSNTMVPQGVAGELCIGGGGVTRGYLNQSELTAEKFVKDPFVCEDAARMYRTGDLVRWQQDGNLSFIGRIDHQVKIRGLRIEPGEIEARLSEMSMVKQAVVLVQPLENTSAELVAYVVPNAVHDNLEAMLQAALRLHLPDYMVPQHFMLLDSLPLTPNSKVDRKTLATLFKAKPQAYQAPQTEREQQLQQLWAEVLTRDPQQLSCNANFFALGGHSLLVAKLIHLAARQYDLHIAVKDVFAAPTIVRLAQLLDGSSAATGIISHQGDEPVPLAYAQYRVWFVEQLLPGSNQNNMTAGFVLKGKVDVSRLRDAFARMIDQHDILRTQLFAGDEQPQQITLTQGVVDFDYHDLTAMPESLKAQQSDELVLAHNTAPFNLNRLPLIRALLVKHDDTHWRLHTCCHHLIADGWSQMQFFTQWFALYDNDPARDIETPPYSYRDYVLWQQNYLKSAQAKQSEQFWHDYLQDCSGQLTLPFEKTATKAVNPAIEGFDDATLDKQLDSKLAAALKATASAHHGSLFNVLHCALTVLLARLCGQTQLLTGIVVSGRDLPGSEALFGNMLNNLPLKADIELLDSFSAQLRRHVSDLQQVLSHQALPFEKILEQTQVSRTQDDTPLFQVFFNMLSLPEIEQQPKDFSYHSDLTAALDNKFKLSIYAADTADGINLHCNYNRAILDGDAVQLIMAQYVELLSQIANDPGLSCGQYNLRATSSALPSPGESIALNQPFLSVAERFTAQCKNQSRTALVYEELELSYSELNSLANQFAIELQNRGVNHGDVVGIFTERKPQLIVVTLACLKVGAAFMMLSHTTPAAMLDMQLAQVPAKTLVELTEVSMTVTQCDFTNVDVAADDMAYIAFTSGTEGKPKAVMGRHSSLSSLMSPFAERFELSENDNFALLSGLVHDPLQRDMFTPLCLGATLHIPPQELMGTTQIPQWLNSHGISVVHLTPSLGEQLLAISGQPLPSLRRGFFVGEVLSQEQFQRFSAIAGNMQVVNLYGSTETGRAVSYYLPEINHNSKIVPLGQGIDGSQLLLLNQSNNPCGPGEVGQIGMRSCHLSLGYMNDVALTQARFIANPFGDGQIYLTGDLGRYRTDGTVEYLGRADSQIKIRGFRVELGHIAHVLQQHPMVTRAAVILREPNSPAASLSAFVCGTFKQKPVSQSPRSPKECHELKDWLANQLPDYMVPDEIQVLKALPLTQNGKLDRKALAAIPRLSIDRQLLLPRNDTERQLLEIWQSLLSQVEISIDDDFFAIGGHSLLATRLLGRIKQQFAVDIGFSTFFANSRLNALALTIDGSKQVIQQKTTKKNTLTL